VYIYGGFNLISAELVIVRDSTTSKTQQPVQLWQQNWDFKTLKWKEKPFRSSVSVCAVPSIDLHWLPFDIRKQAHLLLRTSPNHCDLHANSRSFGTRRLEGGPCVMKFWPQDVQIIMGASIWSVLQVLDASCSLPGLTRGIPCPHPECLDLHNT